MKTAVNIRVNGTPQQHEVEPRLLLVHFLRDLCGLTGTHIGCETTLCGACTVLLEGKAVKSCTILAVQADGCEVTTIEGLCRNGALHPVQEGFWECHALQCGYCTPGMILAGWPCCRTIPTLRERKSPRPWKGTFAGAPVIRILLMRLSLRRRRMSPVKPI